MKRFVVVGVFMLCVGGIAFGHGGGGGGGGGEGEHGPADLKAAPSSHQVAAVAYCKGVYHLTFKDGSAFDFTEFNLRIKTDSGPNGPPPGAPVQISAGMRGDRAYLVFADPGELVTFIKMAC